VGTSTRIAKEIVEPVKTEILANTTREAEISRAEARNIALEAKKDAETSRIEARNIAVLLAGFGFFAMLINTTLARYLR
jgi:ATP-dependent exoDNAse (exonuclease V) beta subunit